MNAMVPANMGGALSTRFQGVAIENDLGAGIQGGFGHIAYKGKVWTIKHRGEERQLMRDDDDGPRGSIEVVILKAATVVSKIFYLNGYTEGATEAPDCFSSNGVTPDAGSAKKQANVCAACPHNAFGSKVSQDGKGGKGKACSDSKRLAVVPLGDIPNEVYGGPLLLRVPAASLSDCDKYGATMQKLGYPYYAIGTKIAFSADDAYPKFVFNGIRALTDEEADAVIAMRESPEVSRVLAEDIGATTAGVSQEAALAKAFEQPPAPKAPPAPPAPAPVAAAPKPVAAAPKPVAPKPAPLAEVLAPVKSTGFGGATVVKTSSPKVPTPPLAVAPPPVEEVQASTEGEATGVEDFDSKLDALLGS